MSPTILRVRGFRFYFFSREEPRAHVHVQHADGEAKFWIEPTVELSGNYGLAPAQLTDARQLSRYTLMPSEAPGASTSRIEVTNVSRHGLWLLLDTEELFLPFHQFPWFREASIRAVTTVEWPSPHHLYWPELDVDLAVESVRHPDRYPLVSQAGARATRPSA